MRDVTILPSLAKALLHALPSNEERAKAIAFVHALATLLERDVQTRTLLVHARTDDDLGMRCLRTVVRDLAGPVVALVLEELARQGHLMRLTLFAQQLSRMLIELAYGREAVVSSAEPITETQRKHMVRSLETRWKMPVLLREAHDPSLIGGFRLQSGDWLYDGSVRGAITQLRAVLISSSL